MERRIHVLVVDDSAVTRQTISEILSRRPGMTVTAAPDAAIASSKIQKRRPDVVILDLQLPGLDGLSWLRRLMAEDPLPVIVCSGIAGEGSREAIRALEEGAVEVVHKPQVGVRNFLRESAWRLIDAVRAAAEAQVRQPEKRRRTRGRDEPLGAGTGTRTEAGEGPGSIRTVPVSFVRGAAGGTRQGPPVALVAASTGGPQAIEELIGYLPSAPPGIVVVQHMPPGFTDAFARRLNELSVLEVKEARSGDAVTPGRVLIAPGNQHVVLRRLGAGYVVNVTDGAKVSGHRPSADVLFRSAAQSAGASAIGVIMSGMGADGAEGLLKLRQSGAFTAAQSQSSCVVFGMPKAAIEVGGVDLVGELSELAAAIIDPVVSRRELASRALERGEIS